MSVTAMIAPHASIGKSEWKLPPAGSRDCDIVTGDHHGFVNGIIILPNSGQARAKLECDWGDCCLRAGLALECRILQPPSPPEFRADRARSVRVCVPRTVQSQ